MLIKIILFINNYELFLPKKMKHLLIFILFPIVVFSQNDKIKVYFNKYVDNNASSLVNATQITNLDDTLVSYIDRAEESIDFSVYNNTNTKITTAINNAYSRGVAIRYIADSQTSNSALYGLNSNINVIENVSTGIMHNKYVIIDYGIPEKTVLITGSTNFTSQSLFDDYNNMVIFYDNLIAEPFLVEFEEMWGSSTLTPNTSNAKFGTSKTDNTQHVIDVNGTEVEVYFSPTDGTTSKIVNVINSTNNDFYFAQFYLTENSLGTAIRNIFSNGSKVKGLIEEANTSGSEFQSFISLGIEAYSYYDVPAILHHKYCIVDPFTANSDPIVVTGSHNWSATAEEKNDENTVIIHDLYVANMFYEEFNARLTQVDDIEDIKQENYSFIKTENKIVIDNLGFYDKKISIYSIDGKLLFSAINNNFISIDITNYKKGVYIVSVESNSNIITYKFVK